MPHETPSHVPPAEGSSLDPFRHTTFTVLWIATVVSNVGTWMQNAAAGWLMTGLDPDPLVVSLVQAATSLPMFVFALPAGALAAIAVGLGIAVAIIGLAWTRRRATASPAGETLAS